MTELIHHFAEKLTPESGKIIRFTIEQNWLYEILLRQASFRIAICNKLAKCGILWEKSLSAVTGSRF